LDFAENNKDKKNNRNSKDNEKTVTILKNMIKSGRIPGAFIFEGSPEITGAFAAHLAKSAVCYDESHKKNNGEACEICEACRKSEKNMHPDIIIAEPESGGAQSFHIDKVREMIDSLYLSPNESDKKVYIIRDMQNMTVQAQNALLKSLEEPPPFAVFIITAANLDLILETVKSRAVKFSLEQSQQAQILSGDKNNYDEIIKNILDILKKNTDRLAVYQDMIKNLDKSGKSGILNFYLDLENAARDILVAKIFAGNLSGARFLYFNNFNRSDTPEIYAEGYSVKKILGLCEKIQEYKSDLEYNANTRLNISSFFSSIVR
jgi:DNA polymerase III delta prime subunit